MILIDFEDKNYTIDDEYKVSPQNDIIENALITSLAFYDSPAQGFKTSFVADKLKSMGFDIINVYDKEMEDAPDGIVY